jgi:hypothetical protein
MGRISKSVSHNLSHAPYTELHQSERLDLYHSYTRKLLEVRHVFITSLLSLNIVNS